MLFWLSVLVAQVADPELQHGGDAFWSDSRWTIYSYPDEGSCDLTAEFKTGEMITLAYGASSRTALLMLTNKHATSLRHNQRVELNILMLANNKVLKSYPSVMFTAKTDADAGVVFVSDGLNSGFLDNFAKADMFGVFTGTKVVGGSPLIGSGAAVSQLIRCSKIAAKIDPLDPFQQ